MKHGDVGLVIDEPVAADSPTGLGSARASVVLSVGFAVAYAAAVLLGRATRLEGSQLALVWPAAAVGFLWLAASWGNRRHVVADAVTLAILAGAINSLTGAGPLLSVVFGLSHSVQAVVTCAVLFRLRPRALRLRNPADLTALVFGTAVGAAASVFFGPVGLWLTTGADLPSTSVAWLLRNGSSAFVFSAVALRLADRGVRVPRLDRRKKTELVVAALVLATAYGAVFGEPITISLAFLLVPLSMWIGLRFNTTIAAVHVLLAGVFVVVLTMDGRGPFAAAPPGLGVLLAQAFVMVIGLVALALALHRDERQALITRLEAAHHDAAEQSALFETVISSISDGISVADSDGAILVHNPAARMLLGLDLPLERLDAWPDDHERFRPDGTPFPQAELPLVRALAGESVTGVDLVVRNNANPQGRTLCVSAHPLAGPLGQRRAVAAFHDVTDQRRTEAELTHQSLHDPLTRLPNRALLVDRLEHALATSARSGRRTGVIYVDLDGFKAVNDTFGHAGGDELLVQVANRMVRSVRPGDTAARLGGDEFAIVCPDVDQLDQLRALADRLLVALRVPVVLSAGSHTLSASVGMALADGTTSAQQLLRDADEAMYGAKRGGKNRTAAHDSSTTARAALATRLLPQLQNALEHHELVMHGQPVVDLGTGRIVAVETLLRWQHPDRGLLPPAEFLAVAEASPLMIAIGRRALEESCRLAAVWAELLGPDAPDVHVNVSGRQLEAGNLTGDVLAALRRYSLPATRLVLELTETHMPMLTDSLRRDLVRLQDRGVRIAIDDLGTGFSSLTRLTELPVDILKIDLRFVAGVGIDPSCDAVIRAILSIGQALGLTVVAEGVETPVQADQLARYGCDTAQGYLYSPPRPEQDLLLHLRAQVPGTRQVQPPRPT